MYCESPEKAQSHIQPRDVSPGLLLLILNSVIREKLEVLQILQVWSAEHVASNLAKRWKNEALICIIVVNKNQLFRFFTVLPLFLRLVFCKTLTWSLGWICSVTSSVCELGSWSWVSVVLPHHLFLQPSSTHNNCPTVKGKMNQIWPTSTKRFRYNMNVCSTH